jgi:hypothetical protein
MKNVTITIDDDLHRAARVYAAERGTSLSALVKAYLESLTDNASAEVEGVRDMHMSFVAEPASLMQPLPGQMGPDGQPYFVHGKWVWTKDGKPRKPGGMRHLFNVADDFDEWPDGFVDALYDEDTDAADNWWKPYANPPKHPSAK